MKFTFKTEKKTGLRRICYPPTHFIKFKKVWVGNISDDFNHRIRFMVLKEDKNEDGNPNSDFKWITLKKTFNSIQEAKEWLNQNIELIFKTFKIKTNE